MQIKPIKETLEISETSEGHTATQLYQATQIPDSGDFPLAAVLDSPELPYIGKPFGRYDMQVLTRKVATRADLVNGAQVTVEWGVPDASEEVAGSAADDAGGRTRLEMRVGTITETVYYDVLNNALRVRYQGEAASGLYTTVQPAEVQRPMFRFTARKDEPRIPFSKGKLYTGKVNAVPYFGFDTKTLLLLGISNTETNKGLSQEVTYDLAFKTDTWRHRAQIVINQRVPLDATLGNGIELYDVFPAIDFAGLGLDLTVE